MKRKVKEWLPYFAVAVIGAVGVQLWINHNRSTTQEVISPAHISEVFSGKKPPEQLRNLTDPNQHYLVRIESLRRSLRDKCGESEIQYLYFILSKGPPVGERPEQWQVVANDIMEQLRLRDPAEERYSARMLELINDRKQPVVFRDYAVQHLITWLNPRVQYVGSGASTNTSQMGAEVGSRSPQVTTEILDNLAKVAVDPEMERTSVPGTVLMSLVNLSRVPGGVDSSKSLMSMAPWIERALMDGSPLATPVRVSVVQAVGSLASADYRKSLRQIAFQQNGQISMRLAAIAALGRCGEPEDLVKLNQIRESVPELYLAATDSHNALFVRLKGVESNPATR